MKIFKTKNIPYAALKRLKGRKEVWAITIDLEVLYGARSKKDLEQALIKKEIKPVRKTIYDY